MKAVRAFLDGHVWVAWLTIAVSSAGALGMLLQRDPPFKSLSYTSTPGYRSGVAFIDAAVARDIDRGCSVAFSRAFVDAKGARWDILARTTATAKSLREFNAASPNTLRIPVAVPSEAAVGPAVLIISLEYVCNPMHVLWPIDVVLSYRFEVLP